RCTRRDRPAAHQVCEVRTKTAVAVRPVDRMAIQAGCSLEDLSSSGLLFIIVCWLLLPFHPGLEVFRAVYVYAQKHLRVLRPAVLRTLPEKYAGLMRIQPCLVRVIWNQVCLPGKLWYPETVIRISGKQFQECRCRVSSVAHGNMEFVRRDHAESGIAK